MSRTGPKYKTAVGLEYQDGSDGAPLVNVKGDHLLADEIVRVAKRFGVPVVEKPEVARALKQVDVDAEIPASLFEAVAVILHELKSRLKRLW